MRSATRILLADEDDEFLEILQSFFFHRGYECEATHSGLDCLARLRRFEPDVLVLDNDLLWRGAEEVLARMREEDGFCRIPVILTSGDRSEHRSRELSSSPVIAQLVKPFSLGHLLSAIQAAERAKQEVLA